MNVQTIELDVSKYGTGVCVKVGQGDAGGTTIKAIIYDGASGFDLSGSVVRMVALLPDRRHYYRGACTVDGNTATHVCDESKLCAVSGYTDEAYFEIEKDGSTYSTDRFALEIVRSALDGQMPSENWDSAVTDMIDKGNAAIEEVGDALRDATEGYAAAEADRTQRYESAESSRDSSFAEAEAARDSAQAENDVAQAKNNADQINNNLMAQANRYVKLGSDEYDHDTGVPTLADPQQGITYLVPKPREGVYNNYDGWVWLLSDDGSTGAWELIGPANPTPDVITTDDIDAAFSGSGKTGMRYMALNAYNYLVAKMKSAFAEKSHKHGDADITAVNGAKLSDASVSRAKLDAGLEQDIADLEAARDSVSQTACGVASVAVTPNGQTIKHVDFAQPFAVAPIVVLCFSGTISAQGAAIYKDITLSSTGAAKDGFDICLVSANASYSGNASVKWIAHEQ